jgi:hypothetical protein
MRKLFLVKIVHTTADMGSVGQELIKEGMAKLGNEKWIENQRLIENFWNELETEIDALGLDYNLTRIYQDGLPCGGELGLRIVRETAKKGSRNYRIVQKLVERGAAIEATESPDLLRKEYEHIKAIISADTPDGKTDATRMYEEVKDELIRERDAYIAKTINATLGNNETGLLFLGAAHNMTPLLAKDIEVKGLD